MASSNSRRRAIPSLFDRRVGFAARKATSSAMLDALGGDRQTGKLSCGKLRGDQCEGRIRNRCGRRKRSRQQSKPGQRCSAGKTLSGLPGLAVEVFALRLYGDGLSGKRMDGLATSV